jgi:hypothetical protein
VVIVDVDPVERRLSKRPRQPVALPAVPNFRFGSQAEVVVYTAPCPLRARKWTSSLPRRRFAEPSQYRLHLVRSDARNHVGPCRDETEVVPPSADLTFRSFARLCSNYRCPTRSKRCSERMLRLSISAAFLIARAEGATHLHPKSRPGSGPRAWPGASPHGLT